MFGSMVGFEAPKLSKGRSGENRGQNRMSFSVSDRNLFDVVLGTEKGSPIRAVILKGLIFNRAFN